MIHPKAIVLYSIFSTLGVASATAQGFGASQAISTTQAWLSEVEAVRTTLSLVDFLREARFGFGKVILKVLPLWGRVFVLHHSG